MPIIKISKFINAPLQDCFDLARSIDIHMDSMSGSKERAIAGKVSGLIRLNESVTWEAVHFGIKQKLTSQITEFEAPYRFVDVMVSGAFKRFRHEHIFIPKDGGTLMEDIFDYSSPWGLVGNLVDILFLKKYMTKLLENRNQFIKQAAERIRSN